MDQPFRERRLRPDEIRRILLRATELADKDSETRAVEESMTEDDLVLRAAALGIPETSVRQAMREREPLPAAPEGGGFLGFPTRMLLEEELPGEASPDVYDEVVDAIQAVTGIQG